MGSIRRVWDEDLRRTLVMKVLLEGDPSESGAENEGQKRQARFLEEAQVTAQLEHPGIIPVHELGLDPKGALFFTMPLVRGDDLAEILRQVHSGEGSWTVTRAVGVLLRVCEAMGFAHVRRVVHRDLKPANIMVGAHGEVYVMDWGLARVLDRAEPEDSAAASKTKVRTERDEPLGEDSDSLLRTMDGEVLGTPAYMAPEQARGELSLVGPSSDVYSLGSILYHLLAGEMPFTGASTTLGPLEVWNRVKSGSPDPLRKLAPDAPEELVAICERAMARRPEDRYPETTAMGEDLRAYLEGRVVQAYATGAWAEFKKWVGRNRHLAGTIATAIVVSFGAVSWAALNQRRANASLAQFNLDLGRANSGLTSANDALARTNKDLDAARRATEAKRAEADQASSRAKIASLEAERQAYAAQLAVAALHLSQGNHPGLHRSLDGAPPRLRGWEWRHLSLHDDGSLLGIELPGGASTGAIWRDSPQQVVAAGAPGMIGVFDAISGELVRTLRTGGWAVETMALAPDGVTLAAGDRGGGLWIWNLEDRRRAQRIKLWDTSLSALVWSPDGDLLAAGEGPEYHRRLGIESVDKTGGSRIALLDPAGRLSRYLESEVGHLRSVSDLTFLPNGNLVSVGYDNQRVFWDVSTGERIERYGSLGEAWACATSPDGTLAIAGKGKHILLTESSGNGIVHRLDNDVTSIHDLDFSPDGRRLVTGGDDGAIRIWDVKSGEQITTIQAHRGPAVSVRFDSSGERILSAGRNGRVLVWGAKTAGPETIIDDGSDFLAALHLAYPTGAKWRPTPLAWLELPGASGVDRFLLGEGAVSNVDGTRILHLGQARRLRKSYAVDLWDGNTEFRITQFVGHSKPVTVLAISNDGTRIATGSEDSTVRLWDAANGQLLEVLGGMRASVGALAFDSTDGYLAIGTAGGRVLIHNMTSGVDTECRGRHQGSVLALAWSIDGEEIASGGADKSIRLWHGRSGRPINELLGHAGAVTALAYHPGRRRLASGGRDQAVRIWNPETGDGLLTIPDFEASIRRVGFGQQGRRLMVDAGGEAHHARVFDSSVLDAQALWERGWILDQQAEPELNETLKTEEDR